MSAFKTAQAVVVLALAIFLGVKTLGLETTARTAEAETAQPAAQPTQQELQLAAAQSTGQAAGPRSVTLRMEADGHYWADARVNGTKIRFLVDTGATGIALSKQDAQRLGLSLRSRPMARLSTANGVIDAPIVPLKRVRVGNVEVTDLQAVVVEEGLPHSLLGMSFLSELKSWQSTPKGLVLKQ